MIANAIALFLSNIRGFMFAAPMLAALVLKNPQYFLERLMNWPLLLSVGVMNLWAGLFHVFAPEMSARTIGWADSPFHFEIGVSDIAIGIIAVASLILAFARIQSRSRGLHHLVLYWRRYFMG